MPKVTETKRFHIFEYLQKNVGNEVDFLPADKHESFLQVDSINCAYQGMLKVPKITSL